LLRRSGSTLGILEKRFYIASSGVKIPSALHSATTRVTLMKRRWQLSMIGRFLDSSIPEAK
jgi:hypothetical protein